METCNNQMQYLETRVDAIRNEEMLKNVTFWQQIINYIFYAIFVMNAFITGLGIPSEACSYHMYPTTTLSPANSTAGANFTT